MFGLMIKDYYDSFRIRKNFWNTVLGYGAAILLAFLMRSMYMGALFIMCAFPMTAASILQYSMEQDEIARFDDILLTYPLTKKEIIFSRFLSNLLFAAVTSVLTLLITFLYVYAYQVMDLHTGLIFWVAGVDLTLLMTAVNSVLFFTLGAKKGAFLYIALVALMGFMFVLLYRITGYEQILSLNPAILLGIGLLIAVIALGISYLICLKIYTRRHS